MCIYLEENNDKSGAKAVIISGVGGEEYWQAREKDFKEAEKNRQGYVTFLCVQERRKQGVNTGRYPRNPLFPELRAWDAGNSSI